MMAQRFAAITLFMAVNLLVSAQPTSGSGGFGTSIVALSTEACDDTGVREWVELAGTSGLLCGRPKHKSIQLITVYAPGCDKGHLILRELEAPDASTLLLFSAPAPLMKNILRATIYLKGYHENLTLFEYVGCIWRRRTPQQVCVAATGGREASQEPLLAFSVEGLGLFSLRDQDKAVPTATTVGLPTTSASSLLSGSPSRGLLPLGFSIVLLAGSWMLSRWIHWTEQNADK